MLTQNSSLTNSLRCELRLALNIPAQSKKAMPTYEEVEAVAYCPVPIPQERVNCRNTVKGRRPEREKSVLET
jgi:hypothetical protein